MVELDNKGFASRLITGKTISRRQDAPKVYEHVASIYVLNPDYLRNSDGLLDGKVEGYDIGIKKTEALHGNAKAKVLLSVKNCNIESDIALNPKIVNGTKIFLFL